MYVLSGVSIGPASKWGATLSRWSGSSPTLSFGMSSKVSSCFSVQRTIPKKTRKRVLSKFKFYNGNIGENKPHDGDTTAAVKAELLDTTPAWRDV